MNATHIIVHFPYAQRDDLFRASDGMLIASRVKESVQHGETSKAAEVRNFLSVEFAYQWLKTVARQDLLGVDPVIEERQGEQKIVPANNSIALRQ